jgi:hypothetical protein
MPFTFYLTGVAPEDGTGVNNPSGFFEIRVIVPVILFLEGQWPNPGLLRG